MVQNIKPKSDNERQSLPCEEPIDLRELFPSKCHAYPQNGLTHYLDKVTEKFYLEQLKLNKGLYSQGVYEAVIKYSASRLTNDGALPADDEEVEDFNPPTIIAVGYSQHRHENRLNYATNVEIELPSGSILQTRSVNISPSGIQLKLLQILDVIDGMEVDLCFPDLEVEYESHFGLIPYRLMKNSIGSTHMTLQLARIDPGDHPFDIFLQEFIENKRHRYRIDSEDSKLALTAKAWEYLYTKALPYLACFVSTNGERLQIQEIAISANNKQQISGLGNSMLSLLEQQMSSFRLNRTSKHESYPPEIYAYRYQGIGLRRRLIATSWQFSDTKTKLTFLRTGINEESFVAWRINVIKLAEISVQRSTELYDKLAEENPEQTKSLKDQLKQYEYLIYLVDITESLRCDPLFDNEMKGNTITDDPEDFFFDDYEIQRDYSADYTKLRLGIGKQRNEERYIYQSPITLKFYGETIKGNTLDLSINGLKVILDKPKTFQIRDTVTIDFIGFNKQFKSSKLKNQSYRIAAMTKDGSICLTRDHRIARHDAAIFIGKLLRKNKDVLPSCTGELWMSTKSRLMESWLSLCLPTQSLLLTRKGSRYDIPYLLSGNYTQQILAPFQIGREIYNFEKLFELALLKEKVRKLGASSGPNSVIEIYLSQYLTKSSDIPIIEVKTWSDFTNDISRVEYLQKCSRRQIFRFCNLSMTRVPRLEKSDLLDDMNVIRRNARHRLTEFETEYQSLVAILELSDFTDLILERYNLRQL